MSGTASGAGPLDRLELRPIAVDELRTLMEVLERAFGETVSEAALASERRIFEADRSLAAFDAKGDMVATAGAYSFELSLPGGNGAPCSGVTLISVRQDHRRRGLLNRMMRHLLDDAVARGEPFAALWASEGAIYGRYGFGPGIPMQRLQIPRAKLVLRDPVPPTDVETVAAEAAPERLAPLYERARRQRPGLLSRTEGWWHHLVVNDPPDERDGLGPRNVAVLPDGGYVMYRLQPHWTDGVADGRVVVTELISLHPEATAALWSFVAMTDLAATVRAPVRPLDDPLSAMVVDGSQVQTTSFPPVYLRVLDVAGALEARGYLVDGQVTFAVDDPTYPERSGTYHLEVVDGVGRCATTRAEAELRLGTEALSTVVLGGVSPRVLAQARRIDESVPGAVGRLSRLLATEAAPLQTSEF